MPDTAPKASDPQKSIADRFKDEAKARVKELEPLVKEHRELTEFLDKLAGKAPASEPSGPSGGGRKPSSRAEIDKALGGTKGSQPKKRRKRKGGTRSDQTLDYIKANPGATATDVAGALNIKVNYLYRILGELSKDGAVKKDGSKYSVA